MEYDPRQDLEGQASQLIGLSQVNALPKPSNGLRVAVSYATPLQKESIPL